MCAYTFHQVNIRQSGEHTDSFTITDTRCIEGRDRAFYAASKEIDHE